MGFPSGSDGKELPCQSRRPGFDPWLGKIPWRREWQPTPVCLPAEFCGQRRLGATVSEVTESDMTEQLTFPLLAFCMAFCARSVHYVNVIDFKIFLFRATPGGLQDPSSPTQPGIETVPLAVEMPSLIYWTPRKSLLIFFFQYVNVNSTCQQTRSVCVCKCMYSV